MLSTILEVPGRDFERVASGLFAYLFGLIDKQGFYEYTGDRSMAKGVLARARASGYILKDCKLYAHAQYIMRDSDETPRPKDFGVTRKDSNFLKKLNIKTDGHCWFTTDQFDRLIAQSLMTSDMKAHIGRLVSKKMSFLMKSYNCTRDGLESALISAALYALYKQYPRYKSALHAKNICKTTIHNTAMNIIQHHTRGKRQALQNAVGGSFTAVHVPLDVIFDMAAPEVSDAKETLESLVSLGAKIPLRSQEFIMAAAGKYHQGLSEFLGESNDDAAERMPYETYLSKLRSFFHVSEKQTEMLFASLRSHLA